MADEQIAKNKLVDQTPTQVDNYYVRGGDFPVSGKGSDLIPAGKPYGFSQGHNELVEAPEGNRNLEDDGDQTPSVWGKGGKAWTVETNRGESNSAASDANIMNGVDFVSGKFTGGDASPVGEVVDMNVHIPAGHGKPSAGVSARTGNAPVGLKNR